MKRKTIIFGSMTAVILIAVYSAASANTDSPHLQISRAFDSLKAKLDQSKNDKTNSSVVAEIDGITIDKERFLFYKANIELTYALNGNKQVPDDNELLNNLIQEDRIVQKAIQRGITVSDQELQEAIDDQRELYENYEPLDKDQELIHELMSNRIRITGLSDNEFWASELVKDGYRKAILKSKLTSETGA
ncbi:hypothetical protein [Paenibacillus mendelii]|uniref:Uncharacterized protein n=1 Tax=Paenibacillus mendelii TaxID=206163 RepID=A0ABV6J764_9BACL|nr:hypothetical protein [Paenibacillus mendelii]MCQ6562074.1 hypothetical protein [Paenibacillus mendelii]